MVLLIDNYDSFVYNLARYVVELGYDASVVRNDAITLEQIRSQSPDYIILSPGPCTPNEAGICLELVKTFGSMIPILGVCLGHQAIAQAYGARVVQAKQPMHGKLDKCQHDGRGIFLGLTNPLPVARYHSLVVSDERLPCCLNVTARSTKGEIMALAHVDFPVVGVQFHPESVLTQEGHALLKGFLEGHKRLPNTDAR